MSTWSDVDPSLEASPVRASSSDFTNAATHFQGVRNTTQDIVNSFSALTSGDTSEIEGKAAAALVGLLVDVADDMRDIPAVAGDISTIFSDHTRSLAGLKGEVDRALAVALTTRSEPDADQRSYDESRKAHQSIKSQIDSLRSHGTEETDPQLTSLRGRESYERNRKNAANGRLANSNGRLTSAKSGYHQFQSRESEINRATAARIRGVNLRSMADPSNLEKGMTALGKGIEGLKDFLAEGWSDLVAMLGAIYEGIFEGNWGEFLWRLNDVLRALAVVLTVVGFVLAVFGIGFAFLAVAGLIIAGATLASSLLLYKSKAVNSETGRAMDWATVKGDMVNFAISAVTFGAFKYFDARQLKDIGKVRGLIATRGDWIGPAVRISRQGTTLERAHRIRLGSRPLS